MRFKDDSVQIHGITPELLFGLTVANEVYYQEGHELVITSLNDASHSRTSLHYSGNAADLRSRMLLDAEETANKIKGKLGIDYDVLFEGDHIHMEYQPRRRE